MTTTPTKNESLPELRSIVAEMREWATGEGCYNDSDDDRPLLMVQYAQGPFLRLCDRIEAALTREAPTEGVPVAWWNGIQEDKLERSPYGPSIRWGADAENDGHDIPLYAGMNPIHYTTQPPHQDRGEVYNLLRSIRYNAEHGSQDRPLHERLRLIARDASEAIRGIDSAPQVEAKRQTGEDHG